MRLPAILLSSLLLAGCSPAPASDAAAATGPVAAKPLHTFAMLVDDPDSRDPRIVDWVDMDCHIVALALLPNLPMNDPVLTPDTPILTPPPEGIAPTLPAPVEAPSLSSEFDLQALLSGEWVRTALPSFLSNGWKFLKSTFGGFLGIFGFLLSLIIVPLYLYYFLIESAKIKAQWSDYLPLRASAFKDEVVSCLNEINRYLIAFFRGQLFVSIINGIATGAGLMIIGLDFGLLIGLALCVAGIIPYLGIALCWIPAVSGPRIPWAIPRSRSASRPSSPAPMAECGWPRKTRVYLCSTPLRAGRITPAGIPACRAISSPRWLTMQMDGSGLGPPGAA